MESLLLILGSIKLYEMKIKVQARRSRGAGGGLQLPQIFAKLCFSLLKKIMLKSKIVHNYKTS